MRCVPCFPGVLTLRDEALLTCCIRPAARLCDRDGANARGRPCSRPRGALCDSTLLHFRRACTDALSSYSDGPADARRSLCSTRRREQRRPSSASSRPRRPSLALRLTHLTPSRSLLPLQHPRHRTLLSDRLEALLDQCVSPFLSSSRHDRSLTVFAACSQPSDPLPLAHTHTYAPSRRPTAVPALLVDTRPSFLGHLQLLVSALSSSCRPLEAQ